MNAEERLEKVRNHLEIATGHSNFGIKEEKNKEGVLICRINIFFTDTTRKKKFEFSNGNIISVKEVSEE